MNGKLLFFFFFFHDYKTEPYLPCLANSSLQCLAYKILSLPAFLGGVSVFREITNETLAKADDTEHCWIHMILDVKTNTSLAKYSIFVYLKNYKEKKLLATIIGHT